jgi:hypothetical protein
MIDAVVDRCIDLLLHHLGLGLILISPEWDLGLLVVGEAWGGVADQLPLRPTRPVDLLVSWIDVVVGKVVTPDPDVFLIHGTHPIALRINGISNRFIEGSDIFYYARDS